jgi:phospholipid transport system substrate-binding protein
VASRPRARAARRRRSALIARPAVALLLALALPALALPALALPAPGGPLATALQQRQSRLDTILTGAAGELSAAQKEAVGKTLAEIIDFREMGKSALGDAWAPRSEPERKEFVAAFEGLVRANSLRQVDVYRADAIDYLEEKVEADQGSVKTTVKSKNATTEVVYTFRRLAGAWRVVDYTVDGVSAVRNYRQQFGKILEKKGFAGLVERLKKRKNEIEAGK